MTTPCAHRFDKVTRHPTRGSEVASGNCTQCKARFCIHDFLDPKNIASAVTYRFVHPQTGAAVSSCLVCQGNPKANEFEQRRLHPWFKGEGPALPAGWQFTGNSAAADEPPAT